MKKNEFEKPQLSEVENLTMQLAIANRKLKESEQQRLDMIANISHDLRAPITAIRSSIDYLNTFSADAMISYEEFAQILQVIDLRSQSLEHLINDLFYLTSLESKKDAFHFETLPLLPFLEEYFFSLEIDSHYANRQLCLDVPETLQVSVTIDSARIIRVLDNLFTNARKYSKENDVIRLNAFVTEDQSVCISVADTGIGIPAESIEKIFQRSYTVSNSRTPNSSTGSGLGLSIVKAIIQRHGGKVWCKSRVGKGSIFYFTLPIAE